MPGAVSAVYQYRAGVSHGNRELGGQLPISPLAPVTITVLPAIGPLWSCPEVVLRGRRLRR